MDIQNYETTFKCNSLFYWPAILKIASLKTKGTAVASPTITLLWGATTGSSQRALLQKRLFQSHSRTPSRIKVTAVGAASSPLSHHYYNNYYQEIKVSLEGHQANQSVKIRDLSNKWSKVYKKALLSHLYFQKLLCPFFTKTFLIGFSRSC